MSTLTVTKSFGSRLDAKTIAGFVFAAGLGLLTVTYPVVGLGGLTACLLLAGLLRWTRGRLETWQVLVLLTVTPYIVLNYGFDNFAVGAGGFHLPLGEFLMFLAVALVVLKAERGTVRDILKDPIPACLFLLLLLSLAHLIADVPRYGLYAVRDSSVFLEAIFLIVGVAWAQNPRHVRFFAYWMLFVVLINLVYTLTFPWGERIQALSPSSGVFHPVPLFGYYQQNGVFLVAGILFCMWLGPSLVRWPRWVLTLLALLQLAGLAILQLRSMYVGIVLVLLLLLFLGERSRFTSFLKTLVWSLAGVLALLAAISASGIKVQGRMGPVDLSFIEEHAATVLAIGDSNARMSHDVDRGSWYGEVWDRVRSSASNMAVGEGFGQALIDFENEEGIPVRQPHNTSLTVLARLGFLGLSIWLAFLALLAARYVQFLRSGAASPETSTLVLWLLMYAVLAFLFTSVQPEFEFSHGAIPFFFLQGLAIGIMKNARKNYDFQPVLA